MTILIPRTTTTTTILFFFFFLFFYGGGGEGTGEGGGEWRLLHESIGISAMHMQLLPGDKVVMFDRTDFGPSNISLPDGRVVILGGRRQFNYEFFPRASDRELYEFPFLEETRDADDENNLYPFLHLLPDGGLFVFANNRSVVFDPFLRRPPRRLPDLPGGAPRNYPSSGSSALLPLRPESPARGEVLVCGGAPRGAYAWARRGAAFLPAERTCGRIAATEAGAAWSVEAMPGPRVMGDMVLLPTGDVLVVNGAAAGTAGWESARDPVLRPALYRPERELGARFEEMARAGRARLYHAAATLDSYGRVLVGGGNPHAGYVFDGVEYPTELSLEAFLPPYLHPGRDGARPRAAAVVARGGGAAAAAAVGGVGYGEVVGVRFRVGVGDGDGGAEMEEGEEVRVVAVAPGFATHAVGMNQRVVGMGVGRVERISPPAPAPAEYEASSAAPPSPEVAPPGYYLWFVVHAGVPSDRGVWVRIGYPGDLS
ncbi:aldehyde oxidase GLOX1-like [Ananas comosus]|uniref:Aldehyde oxidase GLOX1-like n=1 Tax=Ananas comosus TaxID=4615 RepID=A0A6P5GRV4_ANACO|nr:aldehyde oxidase GLOX1-like [Ananas comosus]